MVATTNHLDQLDPGLSSRPSRFDRKYLFPLPSLAERTLYCNYWRTTKLASTPSIAFPEKMCPAIAGITQDFSFAYLKEAFVATLVVIAGRRSEYGGEGVTVNAAEIKNENSEGSTEADDLDAYELWREMKTQVQLLREDMSTSTHDARYHSQQPMDLALQQAQVDTPTYNEHSPAGPSSSTDPLLPFRPRAAKSLNNPRLVVDCDARHAPLMTDRGMFVDSRFD